MLAGLRDILVAPCGWLRIAHQDKPIDHEGKPLPILAIERAREAPRRMADWIRSLTA